MSYSADELPLWPLLPNWRRAITEALEFRTRIIGPTLTGVRQKRRMRIAPRRSFAFEVHPHHAGRRLLENLRFAQGKAEWALPIWHDRQGLSADLPTGSSSIPCNTAGYDFAVGGLAVLRRNRLYTTEFELVEIDSIDPGAINLVNATDNAWSAGTYLYPIRRARLANDSNNVTLLNGEVSTLSVSFEVSEPCDWSDYAFPTEYRGRPVWEFETDWRAQRSYAFNRIITTVDNDTSVPEYYDFPGKVFSSLDTLMQAKGRAENATIRSVLYALAGRYKSLWVPTLANDLQIAGTMASNSAVLPVEYCGYTAFNIGRDGRRDIRIELNNGSVYYRRVTTSGEVGDTEQLILSSSLGVAVSPSNVRRISFLMLMQQSSDGATITHLTDADGVSTLPIVFEGVVEPPSE